MQIQVLALSAQGMTQEEIGTSLYIAVATVKRHLIDARDRLDALNTTHAVVLCIGMGLIDPHASESVGLELAAVA